MTDIQSPNSDKPHKVTELLRHLLDETAEVQHVTVGRILHIFGMRGFACLFLVLALLNIVIFMIPMVSIVFGVPMIVLAVQMILGLKTPIFPPAIRHHTLPRARLVHGLNLAIVWIGKVERYIKPRFAVVSDPVFTRVHGMVLLFLAVMVALPIPLFNVPPSLAVAFLAIGILQRDGLFILLGYATGVWCLVLFHSLSRAAISLLN